MLFSPGFDATTPDEVQAELPARLEQVGLRNIVVTMGAQGAVFAETGGQGGWCPAQAVRVVDTTGAGDAFFAGVVVGLTYGKGLGESCAIGTTLAASTIAREESTCGTFSPEELGL